MWIWFWERLEIFFNLKFWLVSNFFPRKSRNFLNWSKVQISVQKWPFARMGKGRGKIFHLWFLYKIISGPLKIEKQKCFELNFRSSFFVCSFQIEFLSLKKMRICIFRGNGNDCIVCVRSLVLRKCFWTFAEESLRWAIDRVRIFGSLSYILVFWVAYDISWVFLTHSKPIVN